MTLGGWLDWAREALRASGCPDPAIDARWLLEDGLDLTPAQVRQRRDEPLAEEQLHLLDRLLARRCSGEPVQYVTGRADFMGLRFYVDSRVLIPRPDTETLAEAAEGFLRSLYRELSEPLSALDLCAGSGAIGLSLARRNPFCRVALADLSPEALEVARINAANLKVQAELVQGDLFAPLSGRRFHLIACNPPYILRGGLEGLQREVQREPRLALDGGADGLDFYCRLAREAGAHLLPGGGLFLEVGQGQAREVRDMLLEGLSPRETGILSDLQGVERVVWAAL